MCGRSLLCVAPTSWGLTPPIAGSKVAHYEPLCRFASPLTDPSRASASMAALSILRSLACKARQGSTLAYVEAGSCKSVKMFYWSLSTAVFSSEFVFRAPSVACSRMAAMSSGRSQLAAGTNHHDTIAKMLTPL